ncbi:MAG: cupin domain-containing protein [Spirochaetales bacterium]
MNATFVMNKDMVRDQFDWGEIAWACRPQNTESAQLAILDVTITPGEGHNFHRHPDQEEMIYVLSGEIEQWLEDKKQILGPGDAAFIKKGVVHASFQRGSDPAHLLAILGPAVGEGGYAMEDVSDQAPWNTLR